MQQKIFSSIYGKLVGGEDDFVGHIAYSLYKSHKISEIERIKESKGDDYHVSVKDLQPFTEMTQTNPQMQMYRERAFSLTRKFVEEALDSELLKYELSTKEEYDRKYKNLLDKLSSHGFWFGVGQSLLASFIFVFAGILLVWGLGGKQTIIDFLQKF